MIHCLSTVKGSLFFFFFFFFFFYLSLSLTHFTTIHKKRTSLFSVQKGKDSPNYGKTDTFESINWYLYLFFILIINSKNITLHGPALLFVTAMQMAS
jgi:hypothetical protein